MFNTLNESKLFNGYKKKTNFTAKLAKVNIKDFYIPDDLINDRLGIFKGMKDVLANDIIEAIKSKKIIPVDFNEPNNNTTTIRNLHTECSYPKCVYQLQSVNDQGKPCVLFDLSCKGRYEKSPTGVLVFYKIADEDLYDMAFAAYIQYKLITNPSISNDPGFYTKIAQMYGLLLAKNMDSYLSISAISEVDHNKLQMLCQVFCMQAMFKVDKKSAIAYALKSKLVVNKDAVNDSSYYVKHDEFDIMNGCDYETVFPIDNFVELIYREYSYITSDKFVTGAMIMQWNKMFHEGAMYALEHSISCISTIVFAVKGMDLSNNYMINKHLKLITATQILKDLCAVVKR